MIVYICRMCGATLHRCSDTRKLFCEDCKDKVKICNLNPLQIADREIPEAERKMVLEVKA